MVRYVVYSNGGNTVEVLADATGIQATIANGNELTFTIPVLVKLVSAKIRLATGFSSLKVFTGTVDMTNTSFANRWMPIVQAWREDTGMQLGGVTASMDLVVFNKCTINGLISSTGNHIRISF